MDDASVVAGQQFGYNFDDIGNRTTTTAGGSEFGANQRWANYSVNNLNQYTSRTVPGAVDVIGDATNTATVTVNNQVTYRKGTYYRKELSLDNSSNPVYPSVTNLAVLQNGTNADIITNAIGNVFLPQTPEAFTYDADGNLKTDGRWTYTWDAENRLISMTNIAGVPAAAQMRLDFGYDYMSRRISKAVVVGGSTNSLHFTYDGWNMIAELNGTNHALIRSYMWGSDLSGSMQGAGGVGGLLAISSPSSAQFTCFDGNGNVTALVDSTNNSINGQYEYGPFGEVIRATGPMAFTNPFRFSTKYEDDESGFLYYGYRYYNSSTGRWLNKDPLAEIDCCNLYAFTANNSVNRMDELGLAGYGSVVNAPAGPIGFSSPSPNDSGSALVWQVTLHYFSGTGTPLDLEGRPYSDALMPNPDVSDAHDKLLNAAAQDAWNLYKTQHTAKGRFSKGRDVRIDSTLMLAELLNIGHYNVSGHWHMADPCTVILNDISNDYYDEIVWKPGAYLSSNPPGYLKTYTPGYIWWKIGGDDPAVLFQALLRRPLGQLIPLDVGFEEFALHVHWPDNEREYHFQAAPIQLLSH